MPSRHGRTAEETGSGKVRCTSQDTGMPRRKERGTARQSGPKPAEGPSGWASDSLQRRPLLSPSPNTVADIGLQCAPFPFTGVLLLLLSLPNSFSLTLNGWARYAAFFPRSRFLRPHARALGILRGGCSRRTTAPLAAAAGHPSTQPRSSGTSRRRSRRRPRAIGIDSERASSSRNLICEDHRVGGCEIDDGFGSIRLARAPAYLRRPSAADRPGARRNAEVGFRRPSISCSKSMCFVVHVPTDPAARNHDGSVLFCALPRAIRSKCWCWVLLGPSVDVLIEKLSLVAELIYLVQGFMLDKSNAFRYSVS
jgi:hypothetical protein